MPVTGAPRPFKGPTERRGRRANRTILKTPNNPERSEWDSNPRDGFKPPTRFPVVLLRPARTSLQKATSLPTEQRFAQHEIIRSGPWLVKIRAEAV